MTNHPALENCPPNDAEAASGDVYRCAKNNPPHTEDMKTHEESGRLPDADPCLRRALSVFRKQADAEHQLRLFRRWRKRYILRATLTAQHGLVKLTSGKQPTHTSWWPDAALTLDSRAALFTAVAEVQS